MLRTTLWNTFFPILYVTANNVYMNTEWCILIPIFVWWHGLVMTYRTTSEKPDRTSIMTVWMMHWRNALTAYVLKSLNASLLPVSIYYNVLNVRSRWHGITGKSFMKPSERNTAILKTFQGGSNETKEYNYHRHH
jgi:hypothetical protein